MPLEHTRPHAFSLAATADFLGVSLEHVRRLVRRGQLTATRVPGTRRRCETRRGVAAAAAGREAAAMTVVPVAVGIDAIDQFRAAAAVDGVVLPHTIRPDTEKVQRFHRAGGKPGNRDGFYVLHLD